MTGPLRFRFLNEQAALKDAGWDDPARPKLWRYNQHYFEDLQAEGWRDRRDWHLELIARWIADNPPAQGSGWEPYPLSLRIVNWCKWILGGGEPDAATIASLAVQARALVARLEWHLLGNHLFANAKALLFAGHVFDGPEAALWRGQGLHILDRELDEQFLPDGAQFELSPMYHALGLEDLLDLINLARACPGLIPPATVSELRAKAAAAADWLAGMSHPDGRISFFNDAAFGIAPDNASLASYAKALGVVRVAKARRLVHWPESGFTRMSAGPAVLIADLARIGPDYLPGHAHADTLSFELSLFGSRVFVNSGTGEYGAGPERNRQRGTAAHNTVSVAGENSSEVWGGFRVGRRARVRGIEHREADRLLVAEAYHDGYAHLPGRPVHYRRFELSDEGLTITDRVSGEMLAKARFHLHPDVALEIAGREARLRLPCGTALRLQAEGGELHEVSSTWHPYFGVSQPNRCVVLPLERGAARLSISWF